MHRQGHPVHRSQFANRALEKATPDGKGDLQVADFQQRVSHFRSFPLNGIGPLCLRTDAAPVLPRHNGQ